MKKFENVKLLVTDIDNTVFDWVDYYVHSFVPLLKTLEREIGVSYGVLARECKTVFSDNGSIEYPFLIQELPSVISHFGADIDGMLETIGVCRDVFMEASKPFLKTYDGVSETFDAIKKKHPDMPIVALTDAPRYIAMWKMNKLGLLDFFDAIYGLEDPRVPISEEYKRIKVDSDILLKHLQKNSFGFQGSIRILPDGYEKPGIRGMKTVLMDYGLDETIEQKDGVVWIGDNLRKDIGLGKAVGCRSVWARYGAGVSQDLLNSLAEFSPESSINKNVDLGDEAVGDALPDAILDNFSDILNLF